MRIAVCDNEKLAAQALCSELQKFPAVETIHCFEAMEPFWELVEASPALDLVFMDIEWEQKENGLDFGRQLYKVSPDTQIVYVTGYNAKYSQEIFLQDGNLCGYLAKPVEANVLARLLEKAEKNRQDRGEKLIIQQNRTVSAIRLRDIVYLESAAHQLKVHTRDEVITYYERLDNVKKQLPASFLHCHKSYLVNMDYIRRVDKSEILLQNGETVPISKARYPETRNAYFHYVEAML